MTVVLSLLGCVPCAGTVTDAGGLSTPARTEALATLLDTWIERVGEGRVWPVGP